jgi:hypothetical protein
MNILSESLTIGLLLTLVFGALFFYVYSRVSYVEKRVGLIENILIDIKMNQEQQPVNILPRVPPSMTFHSVSEDDEKFEFNILERNASDEVNEQIYSTILEEAHSEVTDISSNNISDDNISGHDVSGHDSLEETLPKLSVNYEAMTKEELTETAKKKGIRISNRPPGREKLLQLIRSSEEMSTETSI